jgi:hypothetical protein
MTFAFSDYFYLLCTIIQVERFVLIATTGKNAKTPIKAFQQSSKLPLSC